MNICIRVTVTVTVTVHVSVHVFSDLILQGLINLEPTNVSICLCFFCQNSGMLGYLLSVFKHGAIKSVNLTSQ